MAKNINLLQEEQEQTVNVISQALSSIYTGVFFIDLVKDRYQIIRSPESIIFMLKNYESAQCAINCAIQNTVSQKEVFDVLSFVNLKTLPKRMESKKYLNINYKGTISGWVRGSIIEVERNEAGQVTQVLYTYQVIDEEKKKELEQLSTLEKKKNILEGKNTLLANENVELQRARDAVYTMLKTGSYLCTYAEDGETLLSIKFSDALRKLYGYANEEEAPNTWEMWLRGAHPDDREYVENKFLEALRDRTGKTPYLVEFRAIKKDGTILWYRAVGHVIRREDGSAE